MRWYDDMMQGWDNVMRYEMINDEIIICIHFAQPNWEFYTKHNKCTCMYVYAQLRIAFVICVVGEYFCFCIACFLAPSCDWFTHGSKYTFL